MAKGINQHNWTLSVNRAVGNFFRAMVPMLGLGAAIAGAGMLVRNIRDFSQALRQGNAQEAARQAQRAVPTAQAAAQDIQAAGARLQEARQAVEGVAGAVRPAANGFMQNNRFQGILGGLGGVLGVFR